MSVAAHVSSVEVASTFGGTYNEIDGIKDYSFDASNDELDTTDFKDTSAAYTKILGLAGTTISLSGDLEAGDTNGQVVLKTAYLNKTSVGLGILFDGTDGLKVECFVTKYSVSAGVADLVQVSFDLTSTGAVAAHS
jgi:predicted secreted protein